LIYQSELEDGRNQVDLNLANGMYLIRITNGSQVFNQRLVVSH